MQFQCCGYFNKPCRHTFSTVDISRTELKEKLKSSNYKQRNENCFCMDQQLTCPICGHVNTVRVGVTNLKDLSDYESIIYYCTCWWWIRWIWWWVWERVYTLFRLLLDWKWRSCLRFQRRTRRLYSMWFWMWLLW